MDIHYVVSNNSVAFNLKPRKTALFKEFMQVGTPWNICNKSISFDI